MNTSKLHSLALALQKDFRATGCVNLLKQLSDALQNQAKQPQQGNHQQQASNALSQLQSKLEESRTNTLSPAWRDGMAEMGIDGLFGLDLAKQVKEVFERNQITPQVASQEVGELHTRLAQIEQNINSIVSGLNYFEIGEDTLINGECELGITVPRKYVGNNLKKFGDELAELEKMLLVFSEVATGSRDEIKIRNISSSELSVFLDYLPEIGACVAIAVERITALYKQLLEIKKLKQELQSQKVPEESLKGIDDHAEKIVKPELDALVKELLDRAPKKIPRERKNELEIELNRSVKKLANRIDRGFNIELRVAPVESDDAAEAPSGNVAESVAIIQEISEKLAYQNSPEAPVLFFPEGDEAQKK